MLDLEATEMDRVSDVILCNLQEPLQYVCSISNNTVTIHANKCEKAQTVCETALPKIKYVALLIIHVHGIQMLLFCQTKPYMMSILENMPFVSIATCLNLGYQPF